MKDENSRIYCASVMGKARLAPVREISIPRLELTAAVISVRLSKIIREELDMNFQKLFYWTDSMSVLKCINKESKRFHSVRMAQRDLKSLVERSGVSLGK